MALSLSRLSDGEKLIQLRDVKEFFTVHAQGAIYRNQQKPRKPLDCISHNIKKQPDIKTQQSNHLSPETLSGEAESQ